MNLTISQRTVYVLCASLWVLAVAGCAGSSYNSTGEWQQPHTRDVPFQTVLVIATVPDSDARRVVEKTLADAITDGGARGIAAYRAGGQNVEKLTRSSVVAMAENSGADSVLVIRPMDRAAQAGKTQDEAFVHVGPTTKVVQDKDGTFTRSLTTNYAIDVQAGSFVLDADTILESSLFELASGNALVYRATTEGHFELSAAHPIEEAAYRFANSIAKQLRSDEVIP